MASDTCPHGLAHGAGSGGALHAPGLGKKHRTAPGTGLGSALVQLLTESPSRAGHAEKHLPGLPGLEATSCSPPALFGPSPGLHWKRPFHKLHPVLGQKQVTADSAATGAGWCAPVPRSPRWDRGPDSGSSCPDSTAAPAAHPACALGWSRSVLCCPHSRWALLDGRDCPGCTAAPHRGLSPRHDPEPAAWEGNWQPELPAASQRPGPAVTQQLQQSQSLSSWGFGSGARAWTAMAPMA